MYLGKLGRSRGLKGGIVFWPHNPDSDSLAVGMVVQVAKEDDVQELAIIDIRSVKDGLELTFEGYSTPEAVRALTHAEVSVPRASLPPLAPNEWYVADLIGLEARDESGKVLGTITTTIDGGAQTLLEVRTPGMQKVLVPAIAEFLRGVELGSHVTLRPIPGLFDSEEP